ncbi:hypothetical protein MERGE_002071 [Pneumocystis wakefieldiae]|uniref:Pre-mRNA-splicing factor CWC15 n=1 Tax=Pneumocystis wakefieldiae TaxID=38082 RepID=A0A899FZS9_9ASCO|nr:hypothetical protein MERGE_002071 [Pneumocystis wakefieldiae]
MTTAHRPTYDPARGKLNEQAPTRMFSSRSLPAYTVLKYRQIYKDKDMGQESSEEIEQRDLRLELLEAEALHFSKKEDPYDIKKITQNNEPLKNNHEDPKIKRAMILQETRNIDADDDKEDENEDNDDRELEKIRRERAEESERLEREKAQKDEEQREREIAMGNPLLNISSKDFNVKRRYVLSSDQAKGISDRPKKEFVNDLLRTEFHKKFMKRYVK